MMLVVLLQLCDCREIFRLRVGEVVAGHHGNCLAFTHTLSQFWPNTAHNPTDQRHHWSFPISVCLDYSSCLLATCFAGRALANYFDLDACPLSLFGTDRDREFSRGVTSLASCLIWANTSRSGYRPSAATGRDEEPEKQSNSCDSYDRNDSDCGDCSATVLITIEVSARPFFNFVWFVHLCVTCCLVVIGAATARSIFTRAL